MYIDHSSQEERQCRPWNRYRAMTCHRYNQKTQPSSASSSLSKGKPSGEVLIDPIPAKQQEATGAKSAARTRSSNNPRRLLFQFLSSPSSKIRYIYHLTNIDPPKQPRKGSLVISISQPLRLWARSTTTTQANALILPGDNGHAAMGYRIQSGWDLLYKVMLQQRSFWSKGRHRV